MTAEWPPPSLYKLTNNAKIVASQMRIKKLEELTGMLAKLTTVMPHPNFPMLRRLRSILVSRHSD